MWWMIGATALSAYGNYMQGKAQAESLLAQADMERSAMAETDRRFKYNMDLVRSSLHSQFGSLTQQTAMSGIEMAGAPLLAMKEVAKNTSKNMIEMMREKQYADRMTQRKIASLEESAESAGMAGILGGAGSILRGVSYLK